MFDINNEKNESVVILSPERSEWVSRSHVTSVEIVVNDGVKTKPHHALRRSLRALAYGSTFKMTRKAPSLSGASSEPIISAESKKNQPRYSVNCQAIPKYDRFYFGFAKVLAFALLFSFNISPSFAANCVPETTIINGVEKPLVECDSPYIRKYTYDSSGNKTNLSSYDGLDWEKHADVIYTYDSSGNLESSVWYDCDSGICEQTGESKYKLGTAPDETKIAKEIIYICSNGVCTKGTESEIVYDYEGNTFSYDNVIIDNEYFCDDPDYECDTELPQSISATPFCPKGCNGCDVERACSSCAEGYKKIDTWCNKIRWTPAEAAEVLRDDNTNEVTITFRK